MNFLLFLAFLTGVGLTLMALDALSLVAGLIGCALMILAVYLLDRRDADFGDNHLPWD